MKLVSLYSTIVTCNWLSPILVPGGPGGAGGSDIIRKKMCPYPTDSVHGEGHVMAFRMSVRCLTGYRHCLGTCCLVEFLYLWQFSASTQDLATRTIAVVEILAATTPNYVIVTEVINKHGRFWRKQFLKRISVVELSQDSSTFSLSLSLSLSLCVTGRLLSSFSSRPLLQFVTASLAFCVAWPQKLRYAGKEFACLIKSS